MPPKHSVWFLGTSPFAVPSLEALLKDDTFSVDLVITQPDRPVGRNQELTAPPIKTIALQHHLKIFQPEDLNAEFAQLATRNTKPDFFVVVSFGQILSQTVLDLPLVAPVNVHASLLPRWRGASPMHHAILAGDTETGVTVQKMVKELDAGPILAQEKILIDPRETVTTLQNKLAPLGAELLLKTLKNPLRPTPQPSKDITVCHKLKREDGLVNPSVMTAQDIDRKVRGLQPWPGVKLHDQDLKLLETALEATTDSAPLPCKGETTLHLVKVQPAGKKPMTGREWERGRQTKKTM